MNWISVTTYNIHIIDSYKIKSRKEKRQILEGLKETEPGCQVLKNRKMCSLINEWTAHNRLYRLGLYRSHTKDVDLEWPIKWWHNVIWNIIGW